MNGITTDYSKSRKRCLIENNKITCYSAYKSKMISRWQGGGAGGVYEDTLRTPTTKPTKIAL